MVLLNDPRGEEIVRERDTERERLLKEGRSKPLNVDIWGDADLGNGKRWGTSDTSSSDGSENGDSKEEIDSHELHQNHVERHPGTEANSESTRPEIEVADCLPSNVGIDSSRELRTPEEENSRPQGLPSERLETTASNPINSHAESPLDANSIAGNPAEAREGSNKNVDTPQHTRIPSIAIKTRPVVGDYLKMQFVEAKVLPSVVDLFFAHPWNNFLHNVVYDILTQVLNGPMDKGFNRQLVVDLFTTGQLTEKILQGQKTSDEAQ
jgi:SIT4-associating protein SAP185/190